MHDQEGSGLEVDDIERAFQRLWEEERLDEVTVYDCMYPVEAEYYGVQEGDTSPRSGAVVHIYQSIPLED